MQEITDMELVRDFARHNSEPAFAELVRRHANLVHGVAFRWTGNLEDARDITQAVFLVLARKAPRLREGTILAGWLYETARFASARFLRSKARREAREQEVQMDAALNESNTETIWKELSPQLEEAMSRLAERDRTLLVLRFYKNQTGADAALALGIREDAAHKRTARALEKLRDVLKSRGLALSVTAIVASISANAVQAAPLGVVGDIAGLAIGSTKLSAPMAGLVKSTVKAMVWANLKAKCGMALGFAAVGLVAIAMVDPIFPDPPADPALARKVLQAAFDRLSQPLPPQMRFVAEVEMVNRPWSEEQVREEVRKVYRLPRRDLNIPLGPEAEDLMETRMQGVRLAHGTRSFLRREWLSGELWRMDDLETTIKPELLRQAERPLPENQHYDYTFINRAAAGLTNADYLHRLRGVFFGDQHWKKEALWEAGTLEPQLAFVLTSALVSIADVSERAKRRDASTVAVDSFAGWSITPGKLEMLLKGKDSRWRLETELAGDADRRVVIVRLRGRNFSLAHGVVLSLQVNAANVSNLLRVELQSGIWGRTTYVSIRDDFDAKGFPLSWTVETPGQEMVRRRVKFSEVEWEARFSDQEVFQPPVPLGYSINGR